MELILKEDVENLGFKDDLVIVKNGYGRNFLIPQGKAMLATSSAKKVLTEKIKQSQNKQKEAISEAQKIVKKLEKLELKISAKSLESDKLFGSVTNVEVAKELSSNGFDIEKKCVQLSSNIKKTGTYIAKIRLHREVYFDLNFEVVKSAN
jgi:large subunit ribosomal protein L9